MEAHGGAIEDRPGAKEGGLVKPWRLTLGPWRVCMPVLQIFIPLMRDPDPHLEIRRNRMAIEVKSRIRISRANLQMRLTVRKREKYNFSNKRQKVSV